VFYTGRDLPAASDIMWYNEQSTNEQ
jgi:hypothetical protein